MLQYLAQKSIVDVYVYQTSGPSPMQIGNFEKRKLDREKNDCFKCQKVVCRTCKYAEKDVKKACIGNSSINDESESVRH